jgi:ComF family protein
MRCVICLVRQPTRIPLCACCRSRLPKPEEPPRNSVGAGLPSRHENGEAPPPGETVTNEPFALLSTTAPFAYEFPLTTWIHQLKFQGQPGMATWLARLLVEHAPPPVFADMVVPVPMHPSRIRERGFNQSILLARHYARLAGLPFADALVKNRVTTRQRGLDQWERRRNLSDSFSLSKDAPCVAGRHIVVVDDVVTTGSTGHEIALLLRKSGAASVSMRALARAPLRSSQPALPEEASVTP